MQKSISVTDQPTNQPTHQPTDRVTYRVACTRLKRGSNSNKSTMTFSSKICQTLYEINEQKILCVPIIKNEFSDNSFKSLPHPYYHHANELSVLLMSISGPDVRGLSGGRESHESARVHVSVSQSRRQSVLDALQKRRN